MIRGLTIALAIAAASGASSPITGDSKEARAFLDAHNLVRTGVAQPSGYAKAWTPIPPIAWSDEVALGAQQWADHLRDDNKCKLAHSDVRLGENLAMGKGLDIPHAVGLWASEGKNYRFAPVYEFEIPTAHYTQVVWRTTTHVGCGIANCGKTAVVVCRYSPAGNRIGRAPY